MTTVEFVKDRMVPLMLLSIVLGVLNAGISLFTLQDAFAARRQAVALIQIPDFGNPPEEPEVPPKPPAVPEGPKKKPGHAWLNGNRLW